MKVKSVADSFRNESSQRLATLSTAERIALVLRLGDEDLARYQSAHSVSDAEARRVFSRARAAGRLRSRSNDPDVS